MEEPKEDFHLDETSHPKSSKDKDSSSDLNGIVDELRRVLGDIDTDSDPSVSESESIVPFPPTPKTPSPVSDSSPAEPPPPPPSPPEPVPAEPPPAEPSLAEPSLAEPSPAEPPPVEPPPVESPPAEPPSSEGLFKDPSAPEPQATLESPDPFLASSSPPEASSSDPFLQPAPGPEGSLPDGSLSEGSLSEEPHSDSDFWGGNVLGWPTETEDKNDQTKPDRLDADLSSSMAPLESSEPSLNPDLAGPAPQPDTLPASAETDLFGGSGGLEGFLNEPEPPAPPVSESLQPSSELMPPPPPPPPPPSPPPSPPPPPSSLVEEPSLPIPGTLEDTPAPDTDPNKGRELDLESEQLKPKGVVHVACLFPQGSEQTGKDFVKKLRDAAQRSPKRLDVQMVFIQEWKKDAVDVNQWAESAKLSGADYMIILVSKSDKAQLDSPVSLAKASGWKGRVVVLEQIGMRSLYTDVLIQLSRIV